MSVEAEQQEHKDGANSTGNIESYRWRAIFWLNLFMAGMVALYIPYMAVMPLYEGRRLANISVLLVVGLILVGNAWLSKSGRTSLSLVLLSILLVAAPTIVMIKLKILMTTLWLMATVGLIAGLARRPLQAIMLSSFAFASFIFAMFYLRPYVEAQQLHTELGRSVFALTLITLLAYLTSSSFRKMRRLFERNHAETTVMLRAAQEKELESQLELKNARHALMERESFLATMSHHLRTPLNAILGYSEMLDEELKEAPYPVPDTIEQDMYRIQIASRHLLELIQDVLDLTEIESGELVMHPQCFDLRQSCLDIKQSMELAARTNHTTIEWVDALDETGETLITHLDPVWIRQVLFNLVSNAIKFTREGTVSITLSKQARKAWILTVQDTGQGMTSGELDRIFEEFVQANDETVREFGGTGLGLPLCNKLVHHMGGELTIESQVGEGTTVTVRLPISGDVS